jgi:hypothetical protein
MVSSDMGRSPVAESSCAIGCGYPGLRVWANWAKMMGTFGSLGVELQRSIARHHPTQSSKHPFGGSKWKGGRIQWYPSPNGEHPGTKGCASVSEKWNMMERSTDLGMRWHESSGLQATFMYFLQSGAP